MQARSSLEICPQTGPGAAAVVGCALFTAPSYLEDLAHWGTRYWRTSASLSPISSRLRKGMCRRMQKREHYMLRHVTEKGHLTRAKKTSTAFFKSRSKERKVSYQDLDVFACGTDQKWSVHCPRREQVSLAKVWDSECSSSRVILISNISTIKTIWLLQEKFATRKYRWYFKELFPVRKGDETIPSTIFTVRAARKDTPWFFSNAELKWFKSFTTETNNQSLHTILITFLHRYSA